MAKKQRTWRWVTRVAASRVIMIWKQTKKPRYDKYDGTWNCDFFNFGIVICHAEFLAVTGIDVQPGTCVKVEFKAKVIG